MKKTIWCFIDSLAWILECLKKPETNSPRRLILSSSQRSSGYVYKPAAEINRLTLASGQMILPGIGVSREWK